MKAELFSITEANTNISLGVVTKEIADIIVNNKKYIIEPIKEVSTSTLNNEEGYISSVRLVTDKGNHFLPYSWFGDYKEKNISDFLK